MLAGVHADVLLLLHACVRVPRPLLLRTQLPCCCLLARPQVAPDEPLMAAGLDSLGSVELRNSLESVLALALPPTLIFDYPSAAAIAGYVAGRLPAAAAAASRPDGTASLGIGVAGVGLPPFGSQLAAPRTPGAPSSTLVVSALASRCELTAVACTHSRAVARPAIHNMLVMLQGVTRPVGGSRGC